MRKILTALTVAALLMPVAAAAQTAQVPNNDPDMLLPVPKGTPARIILDDRAICFGGRIGELRQLKTRLTAMAEERRLRKLGYKVTMVHLSSGIDRSMPEWPIKYYTATC